MGDIWKKVSPKTLILLITLISVSAIFLYISGIRLSDILQFTIEKVNNNWQRIVEVSFLIIFSVLMFNYWTRIKNKVISFVKWIISLGVKYLFQKKGKERAKKTEEYARKISQSIDKILPLTTVEPVLVLIIWILFSAIILGKSESLMSLIQDISPYLFGAIATGIIVNIATSIFLRLGEKVEVGDMIEFENLIGKIEKLGFVYTTVKTPKNELVYIPNIMLSTKPMKRLSKQKTSDEKPYIAHFETTLSYKNPYGIINHLFLLAIRDTADDLENDFERDRIKKGMECIRGLKKDIEEKLRELRVKKRKMADEKEKLKRKKEKHENKKSKGKKGKHEIELEKLVEKEKIIRRRIEELRNQKKECEKYAPYVLIRKLDNYTVNYEFCVFTDHPYHLLKINHYIMKNLKKRFDEFGIEIMSPLQISRREFIG